MSEQTDHERSAIITAKRWYRHAYHQPAPLRATAAAQSPTRWQVTLYTDSTAGVITVDVDLASESVEVVGTDFHYLPVLPTISDEADELWLNIENLAAEEAIRQIETYLVQLRQRIYEQVGTIVDEELPDGDILKIAVGIRRLLGDQSWPNPDFPATGK